MTRKILCVLAMSMSLVVFLITATSVKAVKPVCGDDICSNGENAVKCPEDCYETSSPYCGDGVCNGDETCNSCEEDCGDCPLIPELALWAEESAAHDGDALRAVGFTTYDTEGTWIVSGGEDAQLRNWTPELDDQGSQILKAQDFHTLDHTIYDLEVSGDGSIVATGEGGWNGSANSDTLRIWDAGGFLIGTPAPIGYVYCVAISPSPGNSWTVASGFYGDIVVYDTETLELYATKATKKKRTKALAFSPDGSILASTSTAGRIQLWSFPPQDECTLQSCELELLPVSLSHSGSWSFPIAFWPNSTSEETKIVSGTDGGTIKVWTIKYLDDVKPDVDDFSVDSSAVYCLAWSPDGEKIVVGGDGDITVYDADTLEVMFQSVDAHAGRVNDVTFSPDSTQIASGGADGALKLWDLGYQ